MGNLGVPISSVPIRKYRLEIAISQSKCNNKSFHASYVTFLIIKRNNALNEKLTLIVTLNFSASNAIASRKWQFLDRIYLKRLFVVIYFNLWYSERFNILRNNIVSGSFL